MNEKVKNHNIFDLVSDKTTIENIKPLIRELITEDDRKMFGENAEELIIQAVLYPAAFSPEPSTFDSEAYAMVIDDLLDNFYYIDDAIDAIDPDRIHRLLQISREVGVVDVNENGRLFVPKSVYSKACSLLEQL